MRSLRQWFDTLLDLPAARREGWIEEHVDDPDLRQRLRAMVAAHELPRTQLLDVPVAALLEAMAGEEPALPDMRPGEQVGAFRLCEPLGRGGMATVFLAERVDVDFRQRVAVKLLRRGLQSDLQQQLFRRERRMLASLSHPDIARLIDGGVSESGVPYLVMDYIDGLPITRYAAEQRMDIAARLRLFCKVCVAVDAAHRQLVVHRDLKPSNILVDAEGAPKLLDFGIAKLLRDADEHGDESLPDALTPGYAAPEQYSNAPVSTATDVFALGVLLFELLVGERPKVHALPASAQVLQADPPRWTVPASRRGMSAALAGDLDSILAKAMSLDPLQRYPTAGALQDDLQRHLRHQPVLARTQTPLYRVRKFVQRHRGGVSVASALAIAVLASLATALWQAHVAGQETSRAQAQERIARHETQRANAVRDLLVELFENESPDRAHDALPDTATLLQRGATKARTDLAATPALQVEMLIVIGRIYDVLSRYDDASPLLDEAVAIARTLPLDERHVLAEALSQRGQLAADQDDYARALPDFDAALAIQRDKPDSLLTALTLHRRALILSEMGRHAEAIADHQAAIAIQQARLPGDDQRLLLSYGALGTAYTRAHQLPQALAWQQRALELVRTRYGNDHVETARRLSNYGNSLMAAGRLLEAQAPMAEAAATMRRIYHTPNTEVAWTTHNHAAALLALGHVDEAEALFKQALAIERTIGREQAPAIGFILVKLSRIQELRGDLAGAERLAGECFAIVSQALPPGHEFRLDAELRWMRLRLLREPPPDLRRAALELQARADTAGSESLAATALYVRGLAHARLGEDAIAAPMIERALRGAQGWKSFPHDILAWYDTLARLRARNADPAGAAAARRDGLDFADRRQLPQDHPARRPLLAGDATHSARLRG